MQCDDFTQGIKSKAAKEKSVDDISSTIDMFIPLLGMLDSVKPPVLVVENVPGFMGTKEKSNPINDVFCLQLRRRGYKINQQVFNAKDFGGYNNSHLFYTTRKRMYMVATTLDAEFSFPEQTGERPFSVWDEVIVPNMEELMNYDITDGKVTQDALSSGRSAIISKDKPFSPTIMKAQGSPLKIVL